MKVQNLFILSGLILLSAQSVSRADNMNPVEGQYKADWSSLSEWECPEWFKDAKFGIWAHWGPQCEPEYSDWYARFMYYRGSGQYNYHVANYGNPSVFGLKDLCNEWKAENWNPQELVNLYKSVGARYFMMLANHHDNFDLWNSPYQEWNSVNIGPKRDIVGEWTKAAHEAGLHTGVSVHASHTWTWLEGSQDFDGNLTKEDGFKLNDDGSEKWWKGYDPQELYAQNHEHSSGWTNSGTIHSQWDWGNGASIPDEPYKQKLMNRTLQLIRDYEPDMIYFDDTVLPFYGCDNEWGQEFLASYYNQSAAKNNGQAKVVVTGKQLPEDIKKSMLWDVERGIPDSMQDEYWQTCTCIGDWHYNKGIYNNGSYKSGATVIRMLVDVISKNGNLLLSVPIKGDGTIDEKERKILDDIKNWMDINSESIYGTRTWKTFGEGPLAEASNPMNAQGFNEGLNYSYRDVRFVEKDGTIYATIMAWPPTPSFTLESFSPLNDNYSGNVTSVTLLGYGEIPFTLNQNGLTVNLPENPTNEIAPVFAITTDGGSVSEEERMNLLKTMIRDFLDENEETASYHNSGFYNKAKLNKLAAALENTESFDELYTIYIEIRDNGKNPGGPNENITDCINNLTSDKLIEDRNFSRTEKTSSRFGKPKYWTVENFSIPNGGSGTKEGLDKYSGREALMLGVWDDRENNQTGDLTNARIYRTITLPAGNYFFGASYNTTYNITSDAFIFVSDKILSTPEITKESIAWHRIADCKEDLNNYYGVWFSIDAEKEIILGWQADLKNGSPTQEFRAEKVILLQTPGIDNSSCQSLIDEIDNFLTMLATGNHLNNNTGYFSKEACNILINAIGDAKKNMNSDVEKTYFELSEAWSDFLASRNPIVETLSDLPLDITEIVLMEKNSFTPSEEGAQTRFASPKYWKVENFRMPRGEEGVKGGLDNYDGSYALMLGVWDDRGKNTDGDYKNARIYRKLDLPAGEYFFGTAYNALYNMNTAYVFVSSKLCDTDFIPQEAISYAHISENSNDKKTRGLHFILENPGIYYVGWQADLSKGDPRQEFRAESVLMLSDTFPASVDEVTNEIYTNQPIEYYTIQGFRLEAPCKGINIVKQGSDVRKLIVR